MSELKWKRDGEFKITKCPKCNRWSWILTVDGYCPWSTCSFSLEQLHEELNPQAFEEVDGRGF